MRNIKKIIASLFMVGALFISTQALKSHQNKSLTTDLKALTHADFKIPEPKKLENCRVENNQPDTECTPGAVFPDILRGDLCKRGYASSVKAFSTKTKSATYAAYKILEEEKPNFTLDRFIPTNLGGTNDQANVWPQRAGDVAAKNKVEGFLFEEMCAGRITVSKAQELASYQWKEVYSLIK